MKTEQNKVSKWRVIINDYKKARLPINKYCELHNLKHHQFLYWRRKLEVLEDPISTDQSSFVKVDLTSTNVSSASTPLSIEINHIKINVPLNFNEAHLKHLIQLAKKID